MIWNRSSVGRERCQKKWWLEEVKIGTSDQLSRISSNFLLFHYFPTKIVKTSEQNCNSPFQVKSFLELTINLMKCLHVRWHLKRKIPFWYFWKMFNIRKISQILSKGGRCRLSLGRGWQKSNEGRTGRTDGRINLFGINRRFWLLQGQKIIIYAHAGKRLTWLFVFSFCFCSCLSFYLSPNLLLWWIYVCRSF